mmetsp:Transcript_30624/g.95156  ORF Transcript_30624/g.95156 Transcript_30624/m.95156 type:complete len:244 (+) Transcript_30624:526-1257(+)
MRPWRPSGRTTPGHPWRRLWMLPGSRAPSWPSCTAPPPWSSCSRAAARRPARPLPCLRPPTSLRPPSLRLRTRCCSRPSRGGSPASGTATRARRTPSALAGRRAGPVSARVRTARGRSPCPTTATTASSGGARRGHTISAPPRWPRSRTRSRCTHFKMSRCEGRASCGTGEAAAPPPSGPAEVLPPPPRLRRRKRRGPPPRSRPAASRRPPSPRPRSSSRTPPTMAACGSQTGAGATRGVLAL